jgi:biotin carboxyl carrier protein
MNDFIVKINGKRTEIKIIDERFAKVDDNKVEYNLIELNQSKFVLMINNTVYETSFWNNSNGELSVQINNQNFNVSIRTALQEKAFQLLSASQTIDADEKTIKSPMPGLVLKILKKVGDQILKGDAVMILEAMKMENEIKSNFDGTISKIFVAQGKPVEKYISLFSLK